MEFRLRRLSRVCDGLGRWAAPLRGTLQGCVYSSGELVWWWLRVEGNQDLYLPRFRQKKKKKKK